jgi:tetratricopeptide (TPR) repeat protein
VIRGCAPWLLVVLLLGCRPGATRHALRVCEVTASGSVASGLSDSPSDADALRGLGCVHLRHERFIQAADTYSDLIGLVPEDADAHYYLGVALSKQKKREAAVDAFEGAVVRASGFVEALWSLALLYNERGDGYETVVEMADRAVALAPEQAYCHFVRGFILYSHGYDEQAIETLKRAIGLGDSLAHARYYLGLLYQRRGDLPAATRAFEEVIDIDPQYAQAYYSLASLYASSGHTEDGTRMVGLFKDASANQVQEDRYRTILQAPDEDVAAGTHFNLGQVYLKRGLFDKALHEFEAALEADANHAEAAHNLGVVLSQRGEVVRAIPRFLRAVEIKPEYGLAWENLGNSYLATGDYLAAERSYRQAITFRENSAGASYGLGTALIQQGKINEGRSFRVAARR